MHKFNTPIRFTFIIEWILNMPNSLSLRITLSTWILGLVICFVCRASAFFSLESAGTPGDLSEVNSIWVKKCSRSGNLSEVNSELKNVQGVTILCQLKCKTWMVIYLKTCYVQPSSHHKSFQHSQRTQNRKDHQIYMIGDILWYWFFRSLIRLMLGALLFWFLDVNFQAVYDTSNIIIFMPKCNW